MLNNFRKSIERERGEQQQQDLARLEDFKVSITSNVDSSLGNLKRDLSSRIDENKRAIYFKDLSARRDLAELEANRLYQQLNSISVPGMIRRYVYLLELEVQLQELGAREGSRRSQMAFALESLIDLLRKNDGLKDAELSLKLLGLLNNLPDGYGNQIDMIRDLTKE